MTYTIEESNTGSENLVSVTMWNSGTYSKVAQIFTANRDYTLQAIALFVAAFTPPLNTTGGIYSVSGGEPNAKLEDFTITATKVTGSNQEETAVLDSPLELTEGVQYAIVVNEPASDFFYVTYRNTGSSTYAGGPGLRYTGGAWGALPNDADFYFITYSTFSLTPTPGDTSTGIKLYPTLSWVID